MFKRMLNVCINEMLSEKKCYEDTLLDRFLKTIRYFIRLLEFFIAFQQPSLERYGKVQILEI